MSDLIRGEELPKTQEEHFLVDSYSQALLGISLLEWILEKEQDFETITSEELRMILYGYALGQQHFDERVQDSDFDSNKPSEDDKIH